MTLIKGAGGIILKGNKVLLIKRKNAQIFNNLWANPGGKLEPGETVEECAVREVFEETGVAVKVVKKIVDYEDYREGILKGIYTGFLVAYLSGEANIREPKKFSEMGWFALDALPQPLAPFTLHYLKALNDKKQAFQQKVLGWYHENKRDLPWRKTTDPYAILVSEMMLQQTQVDRVIPYFLRFMKTFPDFEALANADKKVLLEHWSGLGYNNRVLRLQKLAQTLVTVNTPFPQTEEELFALPGIGPYTAAAVLAFAFNQPAVVIDTNIRRVLIAEFQLTENTSLEMLKQLAKELIPQGKSCLWHNALMDYGALQATARKTGISSLSKQSKFEGSERQVRGKIVKHLLKESAASITDLEELYPHSKFNAILEKLERDGVVVRRDGVVSFS